MIAVLDYGIGNLRSAEKALQRVGADARLTSDPSQVARADAVVLPGVGAFGRCMAALRESGMDGPARAAVGSGKPFLGICVGMQMLYESSEEDSGTPGLGVLAGVVRRLPEGVRCPQIQWNRLDRQGPSPLWAGLDDPMWVYFVHSYSPDTAVDGVIGTCEYGGPVVSAVTCDNVTATQFHPEKSGTVGLRMLANWVGSLPRG